MASRELDWEVPEAGWLVVAERAREGWTLSGTVRAWQPVAGGVMALKVPAGGHARLDFRPPAVVLSFWSSLVTMFAVFLWLVAGLFAGAVGTRGRRAREERAGVPVGWAGRP